MVHFQLTSPTTVRQAVHVDRVMNETNGNRKVNDRTHLLYRDSMTSAAASAKTRLVSSDTWYAITHTYRPRH